MSFLANSSSGKNCALARPQNGEGTIPKKKKSYRSGSDRRATVGSILGLDALFVGRFNFGESIPLARCFISEEEGEGREVQKGYR